MHCLAHSLNLCLQDAIQQVHLLRDAMDIMREIDGLIHCSPTCAHHFGEKLLQNEGPRCSIKPLCPTLWTVYTEPIYAVIKQCAVIRETMEEINQTKHDDCGLKANGVLLLWRIQHVLWSEACMVISWVLLKKLKSPASQRYLHPRCCFCFDCDISFLMVSATGWCVWCILSKCNSSNSTLANCRAKIAKMVVSPAVQWTQRILPLATLCSLWPPNSRNAGHVWAKGLNTIHNCHGVTPGQIS